MSAQMGASRQCVSPRSSAGSSTAVACERGRTDKIGFDYVHSLVDDHSRLAYSEILPDEKDPTCAGSCTAARITSSRTASIASSGWMMTDNAGLQVVAA